MNKKVYMTLFTAGAIALTAYSFAYANNTTEETTTSVVDTGTFFGVETDASLKDEVLQAAQQQTANFTAYTPNELQTAFNSMNDEEWSTFSNALTTEQWRALDLYMYGVE